MTYDYQMVDGHAVNVCPSHASLTLTLATSPIGLPALC